MSETPPNKFLYGEDASSTFYCSFCLKSQHEVEKLLAGPGMISICDACVGFCNEYLAGCWRNASTCLIRWLCSRCIPLRNWFCRRSRSSRS